MNTTSIQTEKTVTTGIYIKGNFKKESSNKHDMNNTNGPLNFTKEEAVVRHIFQIPAVNKNIGNLQYTIQQGDDKRLSKDGVLRVYNMNEPIDIPVGKLLGRWKSSHIGITLIVSDNQWCIEGELTVPQIPKPEKGFSVLRQLLRFTLA